jgi:uncharacterized protein
VKIYLDADSCPNPVKSVLFRAAERVRLELILVANSKLNIPKSEYISSEIVSSGFDEADNRIVELMKAGDLVVTEDIPLAGRVISKGGFVITPRGEMFTKETIGERLAVRDMMEELRRCGVDTGGSAPFSQKETKAFAQKLDIFIRKNHTAL